jgi:hypothetical protein
LEYVLDIQEDTEFVFEVLIYLKENVSWFFFTWNGVYQYNVMSLEQMSLGRHVSVQDKAPFLPYSSPRFENRIEKTL